MMGKLNCGGEWNVRRNTNVGHRSTTLIHNRYPVYRTYCTRQHQLQLITCVHMYMNHIYLVYLCLLVHMMYILIFLVITNVRTEV